MSIPLTTGVVLADDHPVVRRGLRLILDEQPDLRVLAEAGDGAEAVDLVVEHDADLAILDVSMPRLTGIQATYELSRRAPRAKVLMLSMHASEQLCLEALQAGAAGYVLKSVADRDLVHACRAAMRGEPYVDERLIRSHVRRFLDGEAPEGEAAALLSPRESEVVKLVAEGNTTREIADVLVISEKTVERHRGSALAKLGVRDRVDLTRYAIRLGLVEA